MEFIYPRHNNFEELMLKRRDIMEEKMYNFDSLSWLVGSAWAKLMLELMLMTDRTSSKVYARTLGKYQIYYLLVGVMNLNCSFA